MSWLSGIYKAFLAAFALSGVAALPAVAAPPLEHFINDPAFEAAAVSPNGKYLATVQRLEKDSNPLLLVFETDNLAKPPLVFGSNEKLKIRSATWLDDTTIVSAMWQRWEDRRNPYSKQFVKLATIDINDKQWEDLPKRRFDRRSTVERDFGQFNSGSIISTMPWDPEHILVSYSSDLTRSPNIYKMNLDSGALDLVARGSSTGAYALYGRDGLPRSRQSINPETDAPVGYLRANGDSEWKKVWEAEATTDAVAEIASPIGQDPNDPNRFYVISNHETDTAAIYEYNLAREDFGEMLFHHPDYDAAGLATVWRPEEDRQVIVGYTYGADTFRTEYIDPYEANLMEAIDTVLPNARNSIVSRSDDDSKIVIRSEGPRTPPSYFLLTDKSSIDYLGSSNPNLPAEALADVTWEYFEARDGLSMPALITKPNGEGPFPVIIMPHGGPVARDYWGFDMWAQTLASRGYLVVQPQFRISSGLGKEHLKAGFGRWGYEMQDDLEDALQYVVDKGYAKADEAAIFGWSYGGYAAFVGSMRSPNVFNCAIPGAGVSEKARFRSYLAQIGDFTDKTYRKTADGFDPLANVDKVNVPVMVIHGEIDERVPIVHSDLFVDQLKKYNKQHEYVVLKGANHFFGTIFYEHYDLMFTEMFDFLSGPCGMPTAQNP